MKTFKFFTLVGIISISLNAQPTTAARRQPFQFDELKNYVVVIGAFKYQHNATRFTRHASGDLHMNAQFEMNPNRNLYYVYVLSTDDRTVAITEARKLRSESEFTDTWVYNGSLGKTDAASLNNVSEGVDINPVTEKSIGLVSQQDTPAGSTQTESTNLQGIVSAATTVEDNSTAQPQATSLDDGTEGKRFIFKLSRADDLKPVEGDVDVIDSDRSRKMATYKANVVVKVADPASKSDNVSMICEVFGYRKVQRDMNYVNPEGEGIQTDEQGSVVVPFELTRLQKGDIAVMYNVYYFKDASLMRPESRYEVGSLLDMLKENPKYKIRIHGHTNGGSAGKIISPAKDSKDYFSLSNTNEGVGTAKALSEERAKIIRDYMLDNGISADRMEIKAWGGKRPVHDKNSARAQENVRVEIEILED